MLLPFILSRSDFLWVAEPVDLENELRNALSACWTIPTWGKGEIGTRDRTRVRKKIRMLLGVVLDNSAHHCCLCSWSSRRTFQFNDDDDKDIILYDPMSLTITKAFTHHSWCSEDEKQPLLMKIVIKTFTSLWCNDDDDDDYRNLNSSLMQSPFWHRNCSAEHPIVFASFPKPNYAIKHISLLLIIIPSFIYWLWDLPRVQDIVTYLFQAQAPSRRISHEQDRTCKSEK